MRVGMRHVEEIFISDYSFFLIISWILVYVANGLTSVFVWWSIQAFSFISVFLLVGSVIIFFGKAYLESG